MAKSNWTLQTFVESHKLAVVALISAIVGLAAVGFSQAAKPISSGSDCEVNDPHISISNTYGWAQWGQWALPGDTVNYSVLFENRDVGAKCDSTQFIVTPVLPSGFVVEEESKVVESQPIKRAYDTDRQYFRYPVVSSSDLPVGDYTIRFNVTRADNPSVVAATDTTLYRAYTEDSVAPEVYIGIPGDGYVADEKINAWAQVTDNRAMQKSEFYINGELVEARDAISTVSYRHSLIHSDWDPVRELGPGEYTVTVKGWDRVGNMSEVTETFTVAKPERGGGNNR